MTADSVSKNELKIFNLLNAFIFNKLTSFDFFRKQNYIIFH